MKYFRAGLMSVLTFSLPLLANLGSAQASIFDTPLHDLNRYDLLLTVGMDESVEVNPLQFGIGGFTELGWDQAKINQFRAAAIDWFKDRFGVDFTNGYYDEASGTVITDFGYLVPVSYSGNFRVLSSNNFKIPPYTFLTPSVIRVAMYVVAFNGTPFNYGGTYANGEILAGNPDDGLNYSVHRIYLNRNETKHETFFLRNYYPNPSEPTPSTPLPNRVFERMQIFSPTFGPGFCFANSAVPSVADEDGNYPTHIRASWSFPGSFTIPDWNGFTEAPVEL